MPRPSILAAGVLLGLAVATAPSAVARAAQPPAGASAQGTLTTSIKNEYTGNCLDDSNSSGLRAIACNRTAYQRWIVTSFPADIKEIKNQKTGRCLDDSDKYRLRTYPCNGYSNQHWGWNFVDPEYREMVNVVTQHCLDDSRFGLRSLSCNDSNYQQWDTVLGS